MNIIGIDLGGTYIKFAVIDKNGKIVKQYQIKTIIKNGPDKLIKNIADEVLALKKEFRNNIAVAGLGIAGDIDHKKGIIRFSGNLGKWKNISIAEKLESLTKIKYFVLNDATIAAWGIYYHEFNRKYKNMLVVTLGTGVGGGIIADGKLILGVDGSAGEIGHTKIFDDKNAWKCGCGAKGCLEAYVAKNAIEKRIKSGIKKHPNSVLNKLVKQKNQTDALVLFEASEKNCKISSKIWDDISKDLAFGLNNLILTLNPEAIIFTGGISKAGKCFIPQIKEHFKKEKFKNVFSGLVIKTSKKDNMGVIGAALYAFDKINEK